MRMLLISLSLLSAGYLRVCKGEDSAAAAGSATAEANVAASATASAQDKAVAPRIGGNLVAVGEFNVEVLVRHAGQVEALVSDASGKLVSDGVKLAVTAQGNAGASEKVELAFAAPSARFQGKAKGELSTGPLEVSLDVGGKALSGKLTAAVAVPEPKFGGQVLTAGGYSAELFVRPSGEVRAFVRDGAGADVKGGVDCKAKLKTKAGASEDVALSFDAPSASFVGHAKAGAELAPGPIEFSVSAGAGAQASLGGLERIALSVSATHGGQVVVVGDYSVELVVKGKEVAAFVFDASGKAVAAADLDLKLDVGAGAGAAVALKWDAPSLSYKGKLDADLDLNVEPIRVSIAAGGKAFVGAVASLKAAAAINAETKLAADLNVGADAKADLDAKVKVPDVKAKLDKTASAAANVKVAAPKVDVNVSKSASLGATAGSKTTSGAKAGGGAKASAGFSLGTK